MFGFPSVASAASATSFLLRSVPLAFFLIRTVYSVSSLRDAVCNISSSSREVRKSASSSGIAMEGLYFPGDAAVPCVQRNGRCTRDYSGAF